MENKTTEHEDKTKRQKKQKYKGTKGKKGKTGEIKIQEDKTTRGRKEQKDSRTTGQQDNRTPG